MRENALVTVIIPMFNAENSIEETCESVFAQTYQHFEIIAVDDGSTDATVAKLKQFSQDDR